MQKYAYVARTQIPISNELSMAVSLEIGTNHSLEFRV